MELRIMRPVLFVALLGCLSFQPSAYAQKGGTPGGFLPDKETRGKIDAKIVELSDAIETLRKSKMPDASLRDVEVYARAAKVMLRNNDFHFADSVKWVFETLDLGMKRAAAIGQKTASYDRPGMRSVRAYRSRIDGSVQPYIVSIPAGFGTDKKTWRLDIVLHGRNDLLTEVAWLRGNADRSAGKEPYLQLEVFGRGNNAYRWAGETDVFEAIEDFFAREKGAGREMYLDRKKVVLRGFSMGGAGAWHLGLQYPDRWCVVGPGAGFSATAGLAKDRPKAWDECLHIYDAVDYAGNAFMVPIVAYSGADDPQKLAADNIEKRLKALDLSSHMTHLIAPKTKHTFLPDYFKKADAMWAEHAAKGRLAYPAEVRFTTWTLKYPRCEWIDILRLHRHYSETKVIARYGDKRYEIETANVRMLKLTLPADPGQIVRIKIDGTTLETTARGNVILEQRGNQWVRRDDAASEGLEKVAGLTGPIDDAFADAFLCVRGSGTGWHDATAAYSAMELARFGYEWSKYLHGDLPLKKDAEVTEEDIANKNLILFGDPSSNSLIAKVLPKLPLTWTREVVAMAGVKESAADHVPVLIYPNPLNPKRYVVLNSGHTFKEKEFKSTNAYLFPRLGDYAILKLAPTPAGTQGSEPTIIGIFDEKWKAR
jgi:pimeloyl-ACP methyl ester carboxylesterase